MSKFASEMGGIYLHKQRNSKLALEFATFNQGNEGSIHEAATLKEHVS